MKNLSQFISEQITLLNSLESTLSDARSLMWTVEDATHELNHRAEFNQIASDPRTTQEVEIAKLHAEIEMYAKLEIYFNDFADLKSRIATYQATELPEQLKAA